MSEETGSPRSEGGLFGSIHRLIDNALGLFQNRLDLLSNDLHEARFRLFRMVMLAVVVLFCLQAGIFLGVLFLVLTAAAADRLALIGVIALILLAAAVIGGVWLLIWVKTRRPLFESTVGELKKDRERLRRRKR